jgi:hypothetical protein
MQPSRVLHAVNRVAEVSEMDNQFTVTELRPIRVPTLAEARLLVPALKLPRPLPARATFEYADWFTNATGGWESIALRFRIGDGWLRTYQVEPTEVQSLRSYTATPRVLASGRSVLTATVKDGIRLVEWTDEDGRRVHLISNVLSTDELTAIAETMP